MRIVFSKHLLLLVFSNFFALILGQTAAAQSRIQALNNSGLYSTRAIFYDSEGSYLDPQYPTRPKPRYSRLKENRGRLPRKSITEKVIQLQSAVKSQGSRGTCSIFASTALLESLIVREYGVSNSIDLSEEWLEYVTHLNSPSEGASSYSNFAALARFGSPQEKTFPYIGETWETLSSSDLAQSRCGNLNGTLQKICLIGHRNPQLMSLSDDSLASADQELYKAKTEALKLKQKYLMSLQAGSIKPLYDIDEVKALLTQGIPVTVDLDFYYATWNHRKTVELGLIRDMNLWTKGIVTYPAEGSLDLTVSKKDPAGHSVVLVGYDDDQEIEVATQMQDGSMKSFKYQGVFYFKNSWGTANFGSEFELNGKKYPGYGMMTQDYAKDYGTFYQMPLRSR